MVAKDKSILPLSLKDAVVGKRKKIILDGISCNITSTGITIIMGPNGAGKTTLLRLIHGLEHLKNGSVKWSVLEVDARAKQSFVFQTPIIMRRTVVENIAYPLTVRGENKKNALTLAGKFANDFGLGKYHDLNAQLLSGGEKQKLAIARALISKPEVVFLDEPTSNLDGQSTKEIEEILLATQKSGTKIIMATHDLGQARRLAKEVIFLNKGKLCEQNSATRFFNSPKSSQARAYIQGDIVE